VHGVSSAEAGLVVAVYGVAVFGALQLVKYVLRQAGVPAPVMIGIGGSILLVAFLVAASAQAIPNILLASLLIGVGYSFMHSTLQTWATEVAPEARGTATSLFVTAVFTGASIAHIQISPLASDHRFTALFLVGACVTVPVVLVASISRARFSSS
jgi:predicted MFS family arabinose efflux permease